MKPNNLFPFRSYKPLDGAKYFVLPFLLWVICGGVLLFLEEDRAVYRAVNEQHTAFGDFIFPYITHIGEGYVIIATLLLLLFIPRLRKPKFFLAMAVCNLSPFLITQAVKGLINAPRPLKYFPETSWIKQVAGQPLNYDFSFPSGHSEGSFAFLCFLALLLPRKYVFAGALLFLLALGVGYSRIYLSQHFFADVYVGSLIGTLCCLISFAWINPFKEPAEAVSKTHLQNEEVL